MAMSISFLKIAYTVADDRPLSDQRSRKTDQSVRPLLQALFAAIPDARRPRWACVENDGHKIAEKHRPHLQKYGRFSLNDVLETVRITQQRFDPAPGIALQGGERVA